MSGSSTPTSWVLVPEKFGTVAAFSAPAWAVRAPSAIAPRASGPPAGIGTWVNPSGTARPGRPYGPTTLSAAVRRSFNAVSHVSKAASLNAAVGTFGRSSTRVPGSECLEPDVHPESSRPTIASSTAGRRGRFMPAWTPGAALRFPRPSVAEARQNDHAAGGCHERLGAQAFKHLLEVGDVG